jgi:hypothetical protein
MPIRFGERDRLALVEAYRTLMDLARPLVAPDDFCRFLDGMGRIPPGWEFT